MASALGGSVARRYARALFAIGVDAGNFEALGREIGDLATLWSSSTELRETLRNPVFTGSEKRAVLGKILPRVTPTLAVQRTAFLLLERQRIVLLPAIARAYRELADAHTGRVRARVTSAQPLGDAALDRVRRSLERRTGKHVILETVVDPGVIGGVVAQVGDLVLDGSIRTQLAALRQKLLN
jgi:F-type H+-transporting ATPase subunit delta